MSRPNIICPSKYLVVVLIVDRIAHAVACKTRSTSLLQCLPWNSVTQNILASIRCTLSTTELARGFLTVVGSLSIP
eukprot:14122988-Ditylum_brightwellii.AAC.1